MRAVTVKLMILSLVLENHIAMMMSQNPSPVPPPKPGRLGMGIFINMPPPPPLPPPKPPPLRPRLLNDAAVDDATGVLVLGSLRRLALLPLVLRLLAARFLPPPPAAPRLKPLVPPRPRPRDRPRPRPRK